MFIYYFIKLRLVLATLFFKKYKKVKNIKIRYTTDGSEPNKNSTLYMDTIKLNNSSILKCSFKPLKSLDQMKNFGFLIL